MPWVRKSQISAASDITTSALVRSSTNTQAAVKDLIGNEVAGAVEGAISSSTTVVNAARDAAVSAVNGVLADASVVTGAQSGPFMTVAGAPIHGALTDEDGRMSPFGWTPAGRVHPWSAQVVGEDVAGMYLGATPGHAASFADEAGRVLFRVRDDGAFESPAAATTRHGFLPVVSGSNVIVHDLDSGRVATISAGGAVTDVPRVVGRAVVFTVGGVLMWGPVTGGTAAAVLGNPASWSGWGSSSIYNWRTQLASLATGKGSTYFDGGVGSEIMEHTLARFGTRRALADAFTIPAATTPVTVPMLNLPTMSGNWVGWTCTINGVAGTMTKASGAGEPYQFTRTTAGSATAVASGTPIIPVQGPARRGDLLIFNLAKNNLTAATDVDALIDMAWDAYNAATTLTKRVLVVGHFANTNMIDGHIGARQLREFDSAMKAMARERFVPVQEPLMSPRVWAETGITPTPEDLTAQRNGVKPPSLSRNDSHLSVAGDQWVVSMIQQKLAALGWA